MNLKRVLLDCLLPEQMKELCAELEVEADRRSTAAMLAALASSKRAKPEHIIETLTVAQLRQALEEHGHATDGRRDELVKRLLEAGGRADPAPAAREHIARDSGLAARLTGQPETRTRVARTGPDIAQQYRHSTEAVQRPEAGVQDQFQARKPPRTYRYDSSLDPALSWDEQRERDLGEWLLGLVLSAAKEGEQSVFAEAHEWKGGGVRITSLADAAQMLQRIGKPFLNWAGKAERHEIKVPTAPLFVHERHSTKAILDGIRHRKARGQTLDLFGDPGMDIRENLEAYEHKGPWQNRMILGDSLAVMNSLLEFEGMAGQVQMIYIDPPYGVKFGSNFQPFVRSQKVKHGGDEDMTREPEMVKAYRDTWDLGLHSYLTYLRDRLVIARDLLHDSGSVFVQISDENIHHVREVMDEVFGSENAVSIISFTKTASTATNLLGTECDFLIWYARDISRVKYRQLFLPKTIGTYKSYKYVVSGDAKEYRSLTSAERDNPSTIPDGWKIAQLSFAVSQEAGRPEERYYKFRGVTYDCGANRHWKTTNPAGLDRLARANRLIGLASQLNYVRYLDDFPATPLTNTWSDTGSAGYSNADPKLYVVQTDRLVIQRCLLMATDPGDLVLDPTCGSGTTAYVAEQWGRRWITIDTSRVPLALARQRLLTATFPYYELKSPLVGPAGGFVYQRRQNRKGEEVGGLVPHITLKSIANDEHPAMEVLV